VKAAKHILQALRKGSVSVDKSHFWRELYDAKIKSL